MHIRPWPRRHRVAAGRGGTPGRRVLFPLLQIVALAGVAFFVGALAGWAVGGLVACLEAAWVTEGLS